MPRNGSDKQVSSEERERRIRKVIFHALSGPGAPFSATRLTTFMRGAFWVNAPTGKEIKDQLDRLVDLCAITRTESGYDIL
jgi:hypothetical protein